MTCLSNTPPVHPPADRSGLQHATSTPRLPSAAFCLPIGANFPLLRAPRRPTACRAPKGNPALFGRRRLIYNVSPPADGGLREHVPTRPRWTTPRLRCLCVVPPVWMGLPPDATALVPPLPCASPSAPLRPGMGTCTPQALCPAWHTRAALSGAQSCASGPVPDCVKTPGLSDFSAANH